MTNKQLRELVEAGECGKSSIQRLAEMQMRLHERMKSPVEKLGELMMQNVENAPAGSADIPPAKQKTLAPATQDLFKTPEQRRSAIDRALKVTGTAGALDCRLGTNQFQRSRWTTDRLARNKNTEVRDRIEATLRKIWATSK